MCFFCDLYCCRFVKSPLGEMKEELSSVTKDCDVEVVKLEQSLKHLETAFESSKKRFETMIRQSAEATRASS